MAELLTSAQMRAIERAAIDSGRTSGAALMERAGAEVVRAIGSVWPDLAAAPAAALVLCGPGNNGGDGFVIARLLHEAGWTVEVAHLAPAAELPPDAARARARWDDCGPVAPLGRPRVLASPALVIDALFGIGLGRPLSPEVALALAAAAAADGARHVAVDLPSGLDGDSGRVLGAAAFHADLTVTFHAAKLGHYLAEGPEHCGRLVVADIGLDPRGRATAARGRTAASAAGGPDPGGPEPGGRGRSASCALVRDGDAGYPPGPAWSPPVDLAQFWASGDPSPPQPIPPQPPPPQPIPIPPQPQPQPMQPLRGPQERATAAVAAQVRAVDDHTPADAASAASPAPEGAGSVSSPARLIEAPAWRLGKAAAGHKYSHGHVLVAAGGRGATGAARLAARAALRIGAGLVSLGAPAGAEAEIAAQITALMMRRLPDGGALARMLGADGRINALCLGPGLGVARAAGLLSAALTSGRAAVLDADALSAIAGAPDRLMPLVHERCVLTPHDGEFARLFPDLAQALAEPAARGPAFSRLDAARAAAARSGAVVVLKGAATVIAAPGGAGAVHGAVYARAAPWLATAGSGDVLAGLIAGLLARGAPPFQAAQTGVFAHVEAARRFGPGLIAEDLPEMLPAVLQAWPA